MFESSARHLIEKGQSFIIGYTIIDHRGRNHRNFVSQELSTMEEMGAVMEELQRQAPTGSAWFITRPEDFQKLTPNQTTVLKIPEAA